MSRVLRGTGAGATDGGGGCGRRTHRLGQQQEVRIFRFIVDHSIEEIIVERAQHKLNIDEKVRPVPRPMRRPTADAERECGMGPQVIQAGKFDLKTTTTERDLILKAIMQREREGEGEEGEESPVRLARVPPPPQAGRRTVLTPAAPCTGVR
jgi:hypothetical protein